MSRFSLITVALAVSLVELERSAVSIRRQSCADWDWHIYVGEHVGTHGQDFLRALQRADSRVRVTRQSAGSTQAVRAQAVEAVLGEFVMWLESGDELERDAFERFDEVIAGVADLDLVYADALVLDRVAQTYARDYKPAWSPDRLRCQFYLDGCVAYRVALVLAVGGLRSEFGDAAAYDLALRVSEQARSIRHVTAALLRCNRPAAPQTSSGMVRAVREHCERIGLSVRDVVEGAVPGTVTLHRRVVGEPLVSVVIPSMGPMAVVRGEERSLLESIVADLVERTSYTNIEVLIVPDPDSPQDLMDRCVAMDPVRVRVLEPVPKPFNYSVKVNLGAAQASGDYLLFLNDDTEVTHPDWLECMLAIAQQDDVGMVGAYLQFEDESIQHAGVFLHGGPGHIGFRQMPADFADPALLAVDRECITITGACMLMPYEVYDELGGHTLILPSNWDDVDLGLKVVMSGRRVVWTPHARLFHFESMSRDPWVQYFELLRFWGRWATEVLADPWFTPPIGPSSYSWPAERYR